MIQSLNDTMSAEEAQALLFGGGPGARVKDPRRILTGRLAASSGDEFEKALDDTHAVYARDGRALLEKLPVKTSPMPRSWLRNKEQAGMARILSGRARFDFYGTLGIDLLPGWPARAVAMEAKNTRERTTSLPIIAHDRKGSGLQEHQLHACVEAAGRFGTLAVVVWNNGGERLVFLPPALAAAWRAFRLGQRKSLSVDTAVPYPNPEHPHAASFEDWLTPAVEWATRAEDGWRAGK